MKQEISTLIRSMRGVTTALATPLNSDGSLDVESLERLIDNQISAGIACIFPLGWCGEGPLLADEIRAEVIRHSCRIVRGRVPVMVGVSEQSPARARPLIRIAEDAGADMVLATPPYSYEIPTEAIVAFFEALSRDTSLPVVVYENGELHTPAGIDALGTLAQNPQFLGVKATVSAEHLRDYYRVLNDAEEFVVISGDEFLFDFAALLGVRHFTMGGPGNFSPSWCADTVELIEKGSWRVVVSRQERFSAFLKEVYATSATAYGVTKFILSELHLCGETITNPHRGLTDAEKHTAREIIARYRDLLG